MSKKPRKKYLAYNNVHVSVLLITYNGSAFIGEQLESIIQNLKKTDELIIIDDRSTDNTVELINAQLKHSDLNIKFHQNSENIGIQKNISKGIRLTSNDIVVFSDQDDIWLESKIDCIRHAFSSEIALYIHNAKYFGTSLTTREINSETSFEHLKITKRLMKNLIRNGYIGCCMAINKNYFPISVLYKIEKSMMHDWYLACYAIKNKLPIIIDRKILLLHRRHAENLTPKKTSIKTKLIMRAKMAWSLK